MTIPIDGDFFVDAPRQAKVRQVRLAVTTLILFATAAVTLAAVLEHGDRLRGRRLGLVLSGGNVDTNLFVQVLEGKTPQRG